MFRLLRKEKKKKKGNWSGGMWGTPYRKRKYRVTDQEMGTKHVFW